MTTLRCDKFPNTVIVIRARKIGQGAFAGYYRGSVTTIERSAWLTPCVNTFRSEVVRPTRKDAFADASYAGQQASKTGYVPTF